MPRSQAKAALAARQAPADVKLVPGTAALTAPSGRLYVLERKYPDALVFRSGDRTLWVGLLEPLLRQGWRYWPDYDK